MIIVRQKTNKLVTAEDRKIRAIGIRDEYGNPFRIIKLRWNKSRVQKNNDYVKTRGYEDAIITSDRNGDTAIKYRPNGSIMWMQFGGEGPYLGEVAQTPRNMRLLASGYGDKLFAILDQDIDNIVRKMYEDRLHKMDASTRKLNETKIRGMHTLDVEKGDTHATQMPVAVDKAQIDEQARINQIEKQELEKRKAELDLKEAALDDRTVEMVGQGVAAVAYTEEYLNSQKTFKLRTICKQVGAEWTVSDKKDELIKRIVLKQIGEIADAKKHASGVIGEGLDD